MKCGTRPNRGTARTREFHITAFRKAGFGVVPGPNAMPIGDGRADDKSVLWLDVVVVVPGDGYWIADD